MLVAFIDKPSLSHTDAIMLVLSKQVEMMHVDNILPTWLGNLSVSKLSKMERNRETMMVQGEYHAIHV